MNARTPTAPSGTAAPPLLDLQVNGYAGVDFQRDDLTEAQLLGATRQFAADGGDAFLLTLVTAPWEQMLARLRRVVALRAAHPELRRHLAGWHLEGPFLSAEPGYHGAHPPECMIDPQPAQLDHLRDAAPGDAILLTLAPERHGAMQAIAHARELGIIVSLGHTDASAACLREAVAAGATIFTHLGNACPQQLDRHDNILWRVLDTPALTVTLIPDGIHVSPALFRLIHRALPRENLVYVSDAMSAAGAPPGRYPLGALTLEVGADGIVRQPGRSNFAGSALRPGEVLRHAAAMLDCTEASVRDCYSRNPRRALGLPAHP